MAVPGYREVFIEDLRHALPGLVVAAGAEYFEASVRTRSMERTVDAPLRNRFMFGRRLGYQHGYRRLVRTSDVVVAELNPRTLSTWLALIECRCSRRRMLLWGHYLGRALNAKRPGLVRRLQVRLSQGVITYTTADADRFRRRFPRLSVHAAPNSTERRTDVEMVTDTRRNDFLYVGRVIDSKFLDLIIDGFARCVRRPIQGLQDLRFYRWQRKAQPDENCFQSHKDGRDLFQLSTL